MWTLAKKFSFIRLLLDTFGLETWREMNWISLTYQRDKWNEKKGKENWNIDRIHFNFQALFKL